LTDDQAESFISHYKFLLNLEYDVHEIVSTYQFKMKELEIEELEKHPSGMEDFAKMSK
jgi:hypothetical protein